jgi:formylglycine-generating enzyme required for sulfatase activity
MTPTPLHAPTESPARDTTAPSRAPGLRDAEPPGPGMVWIPGGTYRMGSDHHYVEERPAHLVTIDGFWIDKHPVTNARFARFVAETAHRTFAELPPNPADYPGAVAALLHPGSLVFVRPRTRVSLHNISNWWHFVLGADWRHPQGPGTSISGMERHPVVHVAYSDAVAFAAWEGKTLPTEAEWERAARGGIDGATYGWGDDLFPGGRAMANFWQGRFPHENLRVDGWEGTSPVDAFPPNGYDVHDMIGNVWEWTTDWYRSRHTADEPKACCVPCNPRGGGEGDSYDPSQPEIRMPRKVLKGGSHLCSPNYCQRYRPAARFPEPVDTSTSHVGFRCIVRPAVNAPANGASRGH